jgi:hypothetical protein
MYDGSFQLFALPGAVLNPKTMSMTFAQSIFQSMSRGQDNGNDLCSEHLPEYEQWPKDAHRFNRGLLELQLPPSHYSE